MNMKQFRNRGPPSLSAVVTVTNLVESAPRGAPAKKDNYSAEIHLVLLSLRPGWKYDIALLNSKNRLVRLFVTGLQISP